MTACSPTRPKRRRRPRCAKATGSCMPTSAIPRATRRTWPPTWCRWGNFGARFLVRGGAQEVVEGKVRARTVVLEFPSYPLALDCYRSADYQAAAALRKGKSEFDLVIIEGCEAQAS